MMGRRRPIGPGSAVVIAMMAAAASGALTMAGGIWLAWWLL